MKKFVFTFATVISLGFINAQTLNDKGLYIDNEGELFSGTISQTQNNTKSEFTIKEGVIQGEANYYYASGELMETGFYTQGKKDQKWIRYSVTGSVSAIAFYTLGKKSGTWLVYDANGKKRFEMNYNDGQKSGLWTSWNENGEVISTMDYTKVN